MGELFSNLNEWPDLGGGRLIDFIRCHLPQVGGLGAARKIAALSGVFPCVPPGTVRATSRRWAAPPLSHLGLTMRNFGIREAIVFSDALRAVVAFPQEAFEGLPEEQQVRAYVDVLFRQSMRRRLAALLRLPRRGQPPPDSPGAVPRPRRRSAN